MDELVKKTTEDIKDHLYKSLQEGFRQIDAAKYHLSCIYEGVCNELDILEANRSMSYYDFLMSLECIAVKSGFRLCMERAPLGCNILFYFRDSESGLRSSEVWFHMNHESTDNLFNRLKQLAADFKTRLDENKESFDWHEQDSKEKEFWDSMGENEGYIDVDCPKCGRHRVEHWSCGKDICEKCHWCIQDNDYFRNEYFDL